MSGDIFMWKLKQKLWDIKAEWSELTESDISEISNKEQLVGKLQEKYWYAKEEAWEKADEFAKKYM